MLQEAQIKEHLRSQYRLNCDIAGIEWIFNKTKKNRDINWAKAIKLELAEFEDSFNWKWWKDLESADDLINAKIELSDIYHFILSLVLHRDFMLALSIDDLDGKFDDDFSGFVHKETLHLDDVKYNELFEAKILDMSVKTISNTFQFVTDDKSIDDNIDALNVFINTLSNKTRKFNDREIDIIAYLQSLNSFLDNVIVLFFNLIKLMNMNLDDFYQLKKILNKFRLDNGYQDGTYVKIWNGKEDNKVLISVYEDLGKLDETAIENSLYNLYNSKGE